MREEVRGDDVVEHTSSSLRRASPDRNPLVVAQKWREHYARCWRGLRGHHGLHSRIGRYLLAEVYLRHLDQLGSVVHATCLTRTGGPSTPGGIRGHHGRYALTP